MKRIVCTRPDGGISIVVPTEGARLAHWITFSDGTMLQSGSGAVPVDTILRGWPVIGAIARWAETEDEFIARIAAKDAPKDAINIHVCDESEIPADRTFRNAWEDTGKISVNMPKARRIHRDQLRVLRKPLLETLDVEYQRADERGDLLEKRRIAVEKQKLRDVTADPAIEAATTPEELKAAVPQVLR